MRNWNVVARHKDGELYDIEEYYSRKSDAVRMAKRILRERGDEFEMISVIADNGEELLDETEIYFKK